MARDSSLLESKQPLAIAPAQPVIAHVQLRDLLICPRDQGVVNYIVPGALVEQDMHAPGQPTRVLSRLSFTPNSLAYLPVNGGRDTLVAAGGQEKEIYLGLYTGASGSGSSSKPGANSRKTRQLWDYEDKLHGSINNSVLLTSLSLTRAHESSVEPRVGVSNNDGTVRVYDVPMRVQSAKRKLRMVGEVKLDVAINHSSISPDGRTLLSVGDSNKIYFHQLTGSSSLIHFEPISTLTIPAPSTPLIPSSYSPTAPSPTFPPSSYAYSSSFTASFSTAFSGDGAKFAVGSQEGVVAVWDVRSLRSPVRVWESDRTRGAGGSGAGGRGGEGMYAGQRGSWWSDDPWEWTRGRAPGWCVRSVKFNGGEGGRYGREVMAFTEHTSLVHIVDARTFETHDIIRVPTLLQPPARNGAARDNAAPPRRGPGASRSASVSAGSGARGGGGGSGGSGSGAGTSETARGQRVLMRRGLPVSNTRASSRGGAGSSTGATTGSNVTTMTARRAIFTAASSLASGSSTSTSTSNSATGSTAHVNASQNQTPNPNASTSTRLPSPPPTTSVYSPHPPHPPSPLRQTYVRGHTHTHTPGRGHTHTHARTQSESQLQAQARTPGIVQALGDAFRIPLPSSSSSNSNANENLNGSTPGRPASGGAAVSAGGTGASGGGAVGAGVGASPVSRASSYSPPASIGDSTWRTLGGEAVVGRWSPTRASASASASVGGAGGSGAGPSSSTAAAGGSTTGGPNTIPNTNPPSTSPTPWRRALQDRLWARVEGPGADIDADGVQEDEEPSVDGDDTEAEAPSLEDLISALRRGQAVGRSAPSSRQQRASRRVEEDDLDREEQRAEEERAERERRQEERARRQQEDRDEQEGIVVVPDLGDRDVESEVYALLMGHGIRSRLATSMASLASLGSGSGASGASGSLDSEGEDEREDGGEGDGEGEGGEDVDLDADVDGQSNAATVNTMATAHTIRTAATAGSGTGTGTGTGTEASNRTPSPGSAGAGAGAGSGVGGRLGGGAGGGSGLGDVNRLFEEVIERRRARRARAHQAQAQAQVQTQAAAGSGSGSGAAGAMGGVMLRDASGRVVLNVHVPSQDPGRTHARANAEEQAEDVDMMDVDSVSEDGHNHSHDREIEVDVEVEEARDSDREHQHLLSPLYALGGGTGLLAPGLGTNMGAAMRVGNIGDIGVDEEVFSTDLEYVDEDEEQGERERQQHLPRRRRGGFRHFVEDEDGEGEGGGWGEEDMEGEEYGRERYEVDVEEEDEEEENDGDWEGYGYPTSTRSIRQGGLPTFELAPFASSSSSSPSTSTRYRARSASSPSDTRPKPPLHGKHAPGTSTARRYGYIEDLDLAGLCFDPWGERMYVAGVGVGVGGAGLGGDAFGFGGALGGGGFGGVGGTGGGGEGEEGAVGAVVEWGLRGAEKRWWIDEGWM